MKSWDDHYADLWILPAESSAAEEHGVPRPGPGSGLMVARVSRVRMMAVCARVLGPHCHHLPTLPTLTHLTWPHLGRHTQRGSVLAKCDIEMNVHLFHIHILLFDWSFTQVY